MEKTIAQALRGIEPLGLCPTRGAQMRPRLQKAAGYETHFRRVQYDEGFPRNWLRRTQRYIGELEREKLIRRVSRFSEQDNAQNTNFFEFLWHPLLEGVSDRSGEGETDVSSPPVTDPSPKESHSEESHAGDLDYPPTNRKKRDSRLEASPQAVCKQYPRLQEALAEHTTPGDELIYPSTRLVVDIMDAAGEHSEDEVIACLRYLREERGPAWHQERAPPLQFVQDGGGRLLRAEAGPGVCNGHGVFVSPLSSEEFQTMTEALE